MANIASLFSFRNMSKAVEAVKTGIPDPLPPAFSTITENILGNETSYTKYFGMRRLAPRSAYTSPSRQLDTLPVDLQPIRLTSFSGHHNVSADLYLRLIRHDTSSIELDTARTLIQRQARDHKKRFENTRIAHRIGLLKNGAYYYDANDNFLPNSSGAALTIDFGVPAGNKGQISSIIDASWATDSTNIYQHIVNIKKKATQATGRPLTHAYYGTSIAGWIYKNASFKQYFQFNPVFYSAFANQPGTIPNGFMGLTWVPMGEAFYENESGTLVQMWEDDVVAFTPDPSDEWYTHFLGSEPIKKSVGYSALGADGEPSFADIEIVYGMASYAVHTIEPMGVKLVYKDTNMAVLKNANDLYIADVAP